MRIKTMLLHSAMSAMLLVIPCHTHAQALQYAYDAAGNRVKREILIMPPKAKAKQQTFSEEESVFTDMLHEHAIKIYPNPTDGHLRVCISGLKDIDKCSVGIYTSQGALLLSDNVSTDNIDIDISNQPAGVYLLKVTINKNSTTWKIIKK